ncbi:protocadherin-like wing polarity protein stan [Rhopilema esculentum]|uniref:protocadherin-like wing polarity protein stan n=1 Tax=Rhopilema esculentum TaxID=499914 RepID=UPI0031E15994
MVLLTYNDCANHRPRFANTILVVPTKEGTPAGAIIAIIQASDLDNDVISYSLGDDARGLFRINKDTGELTLNKVLDRDDIITFTIYAADNVEPDKKTSIRVSVHVKDENDNPPIFTGTPYVGKVNETLEIDSFIFRVTASDADQMQELIYDIVDGNIGNVFKIDSYAGRITTRNKLDYEKVQQYILNVSVQDARPRAKIRHITYTTLTINVLDADDNGAAFTASNFTSHIREGMFKNLYVKRVDAYDIDRGLNAPVTFSLNRDNDPEGIFNIDPKTGVVTANGKVDRELISKYVIEIYAKSTHHKPAKALLIIYIDDINDNGPQFVKSAYFAEVMENSNIGATVLKVSATDADAEGGEKSLISYEIWRDDGTFGINSDGVIFVNATVDHEENALYNFVVIARQEDKPPTFAHVTIRVKDENDNSPQFIFKKKQDKNYFGKIEEGAPADVQILRVLATDKDADVNSVVTYSIVPDASGFSKKFRIDGSTGWLSTAVSLDREEDSKIRFLVRATDNAKRFEDRRSADATVEMEVIDKNDNAPIFEETKIVVRLFQDVRPHTVVANVKATDRDAGRFGTPRYYMISTNSRSLFLLNTKTGAITVASSLMPYADSTFNMVIGARDDDGGVMSNKAKLSATVIFKIEPASVDVLCVSLMSAYLMEIKSAQFKRNLQELIGLDIEIVEILPRETKKGCEIKFNAYNKTTKTVVSRPAVLRIYHSLGEKLTDEFNSKWNITRWKIPEFAAPVARSKSIESSGSKKTNTTLYIVIGVSCAVALFGCIGIIYACMARKKYYGETNSNQAESMLKFKNNFDNNSYWCGSQDDFANTSHRLTITSELPDLIEMYGDQDEDEPLANNNTTEEEIVIGKQLSRFDSKASSIPFANSSCGTIYRAPSLASNCSQQQIVALSGKTSRGSRGSRRRRRRGNMGRMSRSEPQLLVRRLSIVLDTDIDIIGGRRYPGTSRRFYMGGGTQGTC